MTGRRQCCPQRADDQPAHQTGVAKPHLCLGGVDVDVDFFRRSVEKQRDDRMAIARQDILISAAHRAHQQFVAHRPAIDDEILVARQSPVQGRHPGQPGQRKATALGFDRQRILRKVATEQCREPRRPIADRRQPQ